MKHAIAANKGRLDVILTNQGLCLSRLKARDMIKGGQVLVNGRIARKPASILSEGDTLTVEEEGLKVTETRLEKMDLSLPILYEDDSCFVINKPAGIPVHPGAGIPKDAPTILHGIAHLFAERKIPFSSSSVLVHRLDKDTTGCLLIAKTAEAHKALQKQFEDRTVKKYYLTLVSGIPDPASAVVDASIGRSTSDRTKMTVLGSGKSREARTTYRTMAVGKHAALLECELHTGRTHQIRVHMNAIKHPIIGDPTYGNATSEKVTADHTVGLLCLHAWRLSFVSPADSKAHDILAMPNDIFLGVCEKLGIDVSILQTKVKKS